MRLSSIRRHIARKFKGGEAKTERQPVPDQQKSTDDDISFLPDMNEWVRNHYVGVVDEFVAAIGSLEGKRILDLGCGEMLMTYGLASRGAEEVRGCRLACAQKEQHRKRQGESRDPGPGRAAWGAAPVIAQLTSPFDSGGGCVWRLGR